MASTAPFSGLKRPAKTAPDPGVADQGIRSVANSSPQDHVNFYEFSPRVSLRRRNGGDDRWMLRSRRVAKSIDDGALGREVQGMHHGCRDPDRTPNRRSVECVVVHDVIRPPAECVEDSRVRGYERRRVGRRRGAGAIEEVLQAGCINSDIDNASSIDLRSRGCEDVDVVPMPHQTRGEIRKKRLRSAALRLANWRHERCDQRKPHLRFTLNARSRGGFTPSTSYVTRASLRARTSAAACG